jgi:hypothetical protein
MQKSLAYDNTTGYNTIQQGKKSYIYPKKKKKMVRNVTKSNTYQEQNL